MDSRIMPPSPMTSSWMLVAGFFFATMAVFVKLASTQFDASELAFYRSLLTLVMAFGMIKVAGGTLRTNHLKWHLSRGLAGGISLIGYFYAIAQLPLATAQTLNYTSPIFLAITTVLILRERFRAGLVFAVVLGFGGIMLLLQPTFAGGDIFAALIGLASGVIAAWAYVSVRALARAGEPDTRIVFWFGVTGTILCGLWQLAFSSFHRITWEGAGLLLGIGVSATMAQLTMTRAYRLGNTLVASALSYSNPVFGALFTYVLWHQNLAPLEWAGMAVIIASGILAMRAENR